MLNSKKNNLKYQKSAESVRMQSKYFENSIAKSDKIQRKYSKILSGESDKKKLKIKSKFFET